MEEKKEESVKDLKVEAFDINNKMMGLRGEFEKLKRRYVEINNKILSLAKQSEKEEDGN